MVHVLGVAFLGHPGAIVTKSVQKARRCAALQVHHVNRCTQELTVDAEQRQVKCEGHQVPTSEGSEN